MADKIIVISAGAGVLVLLALMFHVEPGEATALRPVEQLHGVQADTPRAVALKGNPEDRTSEATPTHHIGCRAFLGEQFLDENERYAFMSALSSVGLDIDGLAPPRDWGEMEPLMPSWFSFSKSEREKKLDALLEWPEDGVTNSWLERLFVLPRKLDGSELLALQLEGEQHYLPIRTAAETYLDVLEAAFVSNVEQGRYNHSPYIPWPADTSGRKGGPDHITMRTGQGWVVSASVSEEHNSSLLAAHETLNALRIARDRSLLTSLRGILD